MSEDHATPDRASVRARRLRRTAQRSRLPRDPELDAADSGEEDADTQYRRRLHRDPEWFEPEDDGDPEDDYQ